MRSTIAGGEHGGAGIEGDVTFEIGRREAEGAERPRQPIGGVLADDDKAPLPSRTSTAGSSSSPSSAPIAPPPARSGRRPGCRVSNSAGPFGATTQVTGVPPMVNSTDSGRNRTKTDWRWRRAPSSRGPSPWKGSKERMPAFSGSKGASPKRQLRPGSATTPDASVAAFHETRLCSPQIPSRPL